MRSKQQSDFFCFSQHLFTYYAVQSLAKNEQIDVYAHFRKAFYKFSYKIHEFGFLNEHNVFIFDGSRVI